MNWLLDLSLKQGWKAVSAIFLAIGTIMSSVTAAGTARNETKAAITKGQD